MKTLPVWIISFAVLAFSGIAVSAADLPEWDIVKWCEQAAESAYSNKWDRASFRLDCRKKEQEAKDRLSKMEGKQEIIAMLTEDTAPNEQSYQLLEAVVKSLQKGGSE